MAEVVIPDELMLDVVSDPAQEVLSRKNNNSFDSEAEDYNLDSEDEDYDYNVW